MNVIVFVVSNLLACYSDNLVHQLSVEMMQFAPPLQYSSRGKVTYLA